MISIFMAKNHPFGGLFHRPNLSESALNFFVHLSPGRSQYIYPADILFASGAVAMRTAA
jgi:hypothetical protein